MKKSEDVTSVADSDIKILLAEDNEINSFLFIEMLRKLGFGCDLAENGEEAVSACGKNAYDIIFMDCKMPVMDGIDATKRIRTLEGYGKKIKIFALTAQTLNQEKDICIQAGMDGFISKPVSMSSLKEIIDKYGANKKTEGNTKKSTGAINKNIPAFMKENSLDRESSEKLMDLFLKQSEKSIK
jgi:two-component system sensor histidine kinase/response regulator